jgi:serine/threonine-protein kinase
VEVEIGDVLAQKYRVESVLGRGGMGYVVAANHTQLDRRVAIKLLAPQFCESDEAVARFVREARACVRIQGEHVARVLDVGMLESGAPFMVMELLEGQDLAGELRARGKLSVEDAVEYILQVCEALAEAHALGIVHRDLKPANLFKTRRGDGSALIKVLDFGISKAVCAEDQAPISLTASHDLIGSPPYMSPEQVRRPKSVDARSDIWSLGVILHELLGGRPPFAEGAPMSVLASVVSDPPESLRALRPNLPEALYIVVSRCLEKDPGLRFQEVLDLVEALAECAPEAAKTAFSRITAIVRSAKHRAQPAASPKSLVPAQVPTLASPAASPKPTAERANWRFRRTAPGWQPTSPAASPRRSQRGLLAMGLVLVIGGIGTVMSQRSTDVRPDVTRAAQAAVVPETLVGVEKQQRAGAAVELATPVDETAASASSGSAWGGGPPTRVTEPTSTTHRIEDMPTRTARRTVHAKIVLEPEVNAPVEAPSATAKPHLDPLEGRH